MERLAINERIAAAGRLHPLEQEGRSWGRLPDLSALERTRAPKLRAEGATTARPPSRFIHQGLPWRGPVSQSSACRTAPPAYQEAGSRRCPEAGFRDKDAALSDDPQGGNDIICAALLSSTLAAAAPYISTGKDTLGSYGAFVIGVTGVDDFLEVRWPHRGRGEGGDRDHSPTCRRGRDVPGLHIAQGWLAGERVRERVRRVAEGGGERYWRSVKQGSGPSASRRRRRSRARDVRGALPLTVGRRIAKGRRKIAEGRLTWEIDEFEGRDLVLAEVELPAQDVAAEPPEWLGPFIVREVTDDPAYLNQNLAREPPPAPERGGSPAERSAREPAKDTPPPSTGA